MAKFLLSGLRMLHPVYRVMRYIFESAFHELFDGSIFNIKNIPADGPFLLACNHASYFDPPFLGAMIEQREIFAFAKKALFNSRFKNWLFTHLNSIPVDRGSTDISAIRSVLNLLKSGKGVMVFPEGTRTSDGQLGEARAGIGLFACRSGVPVIPCRIFGTYEIMNRFSHFPNWNNRAAIIFGAPVLPEEYDDESSPSRYLHAANVIMRAITKIEQAPLKVI